MSHGKLRTENNCLNCNAVVNGRFCSVCGQQNVEPKETFWQLTTHFVYDLFHYDGQFFSTVKTLLFKPGILTYEYIRGKRASYLHPIRLYVFTSAIFFIIFISFLIREKKESENAQQFSVVQQGAIYKTIDQLNDTLAKISDTIQKQKIKNEIDALKKLPSFFSSKEKPLSSTTVVLDSADVVEINNNKANTIGWNGMYKSIDDYKAQQLKLSPNKRDGWFTRMLNEKMISVNDKYKYDKTGFIDAMKEHFLHLLPTMMFISLPLVALLLALLYIRRRKKYTYVQHGIFIIHVYCAAYVFILFINLFAMAKEYNALQFFSFLEVVTIFLLFFYVYKAMRNFYAQSRGKTVLKLSIFTIIYFVILMFLLIIFSLTSLIQV